MPVFLDTNILVYAFDEGEPEKRAVARKLVDEHLIEGDGMISVQVLREFYSATRKLAHPLPTEKAVEAAGYLAAFSPVAEDGRMVIGAMRRSRELALSFRDALIVEAALRGGADRLLSEDLKHGQRIGELTVENPFLEGARGRRGLPVERHPGRAG